MTTIAYDGKSMVCDGFSTIDNEIIQDDMVKIWQYVGEYALVGLSGDAQFCNAFITWLSNQSKFPDYNSQPFGEYSAICVRKDGSVFDINMENTHGFEYKYEIPSRKVAAGSGSLFARAGLDLGLTAKEAVEYAVGKDVYSGGLIQEFVLPKTR